MTVAYVCDLNVCVCVCVCVCVNFEDEILLRREECKTQEKFYFFEK